MPKFISAICARALHKSNKDIFRAMIKFLKTILPDVIVVVMFLIIGFVYFSEPISEGLVLGGHDTVASIGQGRELSDHLEATGERTRWTNTLFSGMPTYQIAPTYSSDNVLSTLQKVLDLGTTGALSYVFLYLIGFYIMLRAFRLKPWISAVGAVAWAFSSYFFIIIAAGHIWKVLTLAFVPPTIGGLLLCYRGKLLLGGSVTALFAALQIHNNHVQMSYYFAFLMALIVVCYGIAALRGCKSACIEGTEGEACAPLTTRGWLKATGVIVIAGMIGVLANLPNLYHTYMYSKESMRGKAELSPLPSERHTPTDGLDRDYITQWSYGIDETLTLLIPDYKGGGSRSVLDRDGIDKTEGYDSYMRHAYQFQQMTGGQMQPPGIIEYWGDQPFTVGPVYVGAIVCFLFVLGAFYVSSPLKWALLLSTLLSLLFAWGKNLMPVTDFFIDYLPLYNKFRTVSSALVVAEFTFPLLAVLALAKVLRQPDTLFGTKNGRIGFGVATALTTGLCLVLAFVPSLAGDCLSANDSATFGIMASSGFPAEFTRGLQEAVTSMHHSILATSARNSGLMCLAAGIILWLWAKKRIPAWAVVGVVGVVTLTDMWLVNKRYLNKDSFSSPVARMNTFAKTNADAAILSDTTLSYRVANLSAGNPFNETTNETSYYHKSIGGYNAAKLHRYQDLIDRHLNRELAAFSKAYNAAGGDIEGLNMDSIAPVLNMLNTKYFIIGSKANNYAATNPHANGNAWFVESLKFAENADAEIAGLYGLDTKTAAVADKKFEAALRTDALNTGKATLTYDSPNELHYDVESNGSGVLVFSEIYYPGWTATIDGNPVEVGRVNYVLRAISYPGGKHKVVLEFRPSTETMTTGVAYAALALIALGFVLAAIARLRNKEK